MDRRQERRPVPAGTGEAQNGLIHLTAGAHSIRVEVTPYQEHLVTVDLFAVTPGLHLGWQPQENLLIAQAVDAAARPTLRSSSRPTSASEGWTAAPSRCPLTRTS